jgi:hypothetical protein
MAFSTLASREMIIKLTGFLILIHLIAIRGKKKLLIFIILYFLIFFLVTHGYLGCANELVPCLNQTHCIKIEQVCTDYHDCVDHDGEKICLYYFFIQTFC